MGLPIVSEFVNVLLTNPFFAWVMIIFILTTDTFLTGLIFPDGAGAVGFIITSVLNFFGVNWQIATWHVIFYATVIPIIIFVAKKS